MLVLWCFLAVCFGANRGGFRRQLGMVDFQKIPDNLSIWIAMMTQATDVERPYLRQLTLASVEELKQKSFYVSLLLPPTAQDVWTVEDLLYLIQLTQVFDYEHFAPFYLTREMVDSIPLILNISKTNQTAAIVMMHEMGIPEGMFNAFLEYNL